MADTPAMAPGQMLRGPMNDGSPGTAVIMATRGSEVLVAVTTNRRAFYMTPAELIEFGWKPAPTIEFGKGWTMEAWTMGELKPHWQVTLPTFDDAGALLSGFDWKGEERPDFMWCCRGSPPDAHIDEHMFFDDSGALWPHETLPPWAEGGQDPATVVPGISAAKLPE